MQNVIVAQVHCQPSKVSGILGNISFQAEKTNYHTYKFHTLEDYVDTIEMFGTMDNYTTQIVSTWSASFFPVSGWTWTPQHCKAVLFTIWKKEGIYSQEHYQTKCYCCIISVQTTIQMDLVRSALHKHIDILCFNAYLHLRLRLHPILRWDTPMHGFYTLLISHSILLQLSSVSSARLTTHEETSIFKGNLSLSHNPYLTIGRLFDSLDIHRIASHLMVGEAYKQLCISGKFLFLWTYYLLINLQDFLPWLKNHLHLR